MQILIDIDEETFNKLPNAELGSNVVIDVLDAVEEGTPLPKDHGDLIDKEIYKKWIETQDGDTIMPEYYLDALDEQETIIEAERSGEE